MTDIELTVRARLQQLTSDVSTGDAVARAHAVKARYGRQRRTRLGVAALTAAVIAIVGIPTALGTLTVSSAPPGGQVAVPGTGRFPAVDAAEAQAAEVAARLAALETAAQAAALDPDTRTRGQADLAADEARSRQYGTVMHECLSGLGFDSRVLADGGLAWTTPPEQEVAFGAALADCQNQTGYAPTPPLSDDAYRVLYADYLDVSRCLVTNGFTPAEPVSWEQFVAHGGRSWSPYLGLPSGASVAAEVSCPMPTY